MSQNIFTFSNLVTTALFTHDEVITFLMLVKVLLLDKFENVFLQYVLFYYNIDWIESFFRNYESNPGSEGWVL